MFYSYNRIRSYNAIWNFIISNRGGGKTFGSKEMCIKNFIKKGEQWIYVRRYKTELKKRALFFDDIKQAAREVKEDEIIATCAVNTLGKTGVEMEAITGVSVALLTVWDMVKAVEKDEDGQYPDTRISDIKVIKKEKI